MSTLTLNADWTVAISTIALVIVTGVLAWFTLLLYRATRTPSVIATIEPNRWAMFWLDLHVQNEGTAAAFDVELTIDPPVKATDAQPDEPPPLNRISVLRAGQRLSSNLASYPELDVKLYRLTISWASKPGGRKREKLSFEINLLHMEGMSQLGGDPVIKMAESIKKMQEDLQRIASGSKRLRVETYTSGDRLHERRVRERRFRRERNENERAAAAKTAQSIPVPEQSADDDATIRSLPEKARDRS